MTASKWVDVCRKCWSRWWKVGGSEWDDGTAETAGSRGKHSTHAVVRGRAKGTASDYVLLLFYFFIQFLVISVRPVISTYTGPSFTKFAGLVEVWANDLKLCFSISYGTLSWQPILRAKSTSNPHLVVRVTFARAALPAYDKKGYCNAGRKQTNYLIRWTQANQLTD